MLIIVTQFYVFVNFDYSCDSTLSFNVSALSLLKNDIYIRKFVIKKSQTQ